MTWLKKMIEVFKIIHDIYDTRVSSDLSFNETADTSGNNYKLHNHSLWPPYVIGGPLYFCPVISIFFYLFFPCLTSAATDWMSTILLHMAWPYSVNFIMQVWSVLHVARCKCGTQKSRQNRHLGTIPQLCRAIPSQLRHLSTIGKNLLSSNTSPTCPHNMVNFSPLAAEILSLVWGTPGNFNGFRILTALLHGTLVVGVSQTAALNRGRHLYSAGRPSRWALAHISSYWFFLSFWFSAVD